MNNTALNNDQKNNKNAAVELLCRSIAEMSAEFNISVNDLVEGIKTSLVQKHYKEQPFISKQNLSIKTGIDRRYVDKYINKSFTPETTKIGRVVAKINMHVRNTGSPIISVKGGIPSLKSIVDDLFNKSESYISIKEELIKTGFFKNCDDGASVEVADIHFTYKKDEVKKLECLAKAVFSLTNTVAYNNKNEESPRSQRRLISNQIPPEKFDKLTHIINDMTKTFLSEVTELLDSEEINVTPGTFTEFGVSTFIINDEN